VQKFFALVNTVTSPLFTLSTVRAITR
jgi:hypothetical protein